MSSKYPYIPDYAVSPGVTLKETLDEKGLSQADLALRTGLAEKTISQIINGIAPLSYETAEKFELALGIPAKFWNARERSYREAIVRIEELERLEKDIGWLDEIPLKALLDRGRIQNHTDKRSLVRQALSFFGVSSVGAWRAAWESPTAQYRSGAAAQEKRPGYVAAWLRLGELQAEQIQTAPFDAEGFKKVLDDARRLTLMPTKEAFDKLAAQCASAGVVLVLTKKIEGAGVSGAVRWVTKDRALIQLSLKYKTHDQLWFTFFHEAGHVLLHGKRQVFVEFGFSDETDEEQEANKFAREKLIPPEHDRRLGYLRTREQIRLFAESIGVPPGIVVGRMQYDDHRLQSMFNDLKLKLSWAS
jgi:HTH-type transcriptional regulator / antitoxin HigA